MAIANNCTNAVRQKFSTVPSSPLFVAFDDFDLTSSNDTFIEGSIIDELKDTDKDPVDPEKLLNDATDCIQSIQKKIRDSDHVSLSPLQMDNYQHEVTRLTEKLADTVSQSLAMDPTVRGNEEAIRRLLHKREAAINMMLCFSLTGLLEN